jgi:hypothetical protein
VKSIVARNELKPKKDNEIAFERAGFALRTGIQTQSKEIMALNAKSENTIEVFLFSCLCTFLTIHVA